MSENCSDIFTATKFLIFHCVLGIYGIELPRNTPLQFSSAGSPIIGRISVTANFRNQWEHRLNSVHSVKQLRHHEQHGVKYNAATLISGPRGDNET